MAGHVSTNGRKGEEPLDEYDSLLGGASRDPCDFLILRLVDLSSASKKKSFYRKKLDFSSLSLMYLLFIQ